MEPHDDYYAIVIGAGAAGLVIAKGLANAGKKVLLIEKGPYGGDCANFGCIPSKTLIASANIAHDMWLSSLYGIDMKISNFQSNRVLQRVRDVVEELRSKNSQKELNSIGVQTLTATCHFVDPHTVQVDDGQKLSAKNIIIATGSYPVIPTIKGLEEVTYRTNESIFKLNEVPTSLAILGGGHTGCELAQAFRRLGSSVIVIEQQNALLHLEEPEVSRAVQSILVKEGVEIYLDTKVMRVRRDGDRTVLYLKNTRDEKEYEVYAHEILMTTGRKPAVDSLNLEAAKVAYTEKGVSHDQYGRTNQANIWVAGDASGQSFFTHAAINQAHTVLFNLLMPWPIQKKLDLTQPIARTIFTDPEVAAIGLTEQQAIELYGPSAITTYIVPLSEADRALCEGQTDGFVKFVTKRYSSKILGAAIVAPVAADMLLEVACAMKFGVPLRKLSHIIHPYPTYSQIITKAADKWLTEAILPVFRRFLNKKT